VWLAYTILLADDAHNFARSIQAELYERYDASERTLLLEPHVTIKQPFEVADEQPFTRYFERLAAELEPFDLVLRGFGFFEGDETVVFVDVEQDPRLKQLQRRVLADLAEHGVEPAMFENDEPVPYHFHATLATDLSTEDLDDARRRYAETPEFRFPVERLGVFRKTAGAWLLHRRLAVGVNR
jgi:2'-5' RNA ligase